MIPAGMLFDMPGQWAYLQIRHEGEIFWEKNKSMLWCKKKKGEKNRERCTQYYIPSFFSCSVLHSILTHTTGVYQ